MDYKEKYEMALEGIQEILGSGEDSIKMSRLQLRLQGIFPELKENEDERMRKHLISFFDNLVTFGNASICETEDIKVDNILAWLEKQGEKNKWKPSKDEMDALYGLAYITNKMDDKKDEAVTKLYQDLKREFFDGASYENMFPSSPVDSPIRDEKQGEQKPAEWSEEDENIKESIITGLEMLKDGASDKSLIALYNKKIEWLKSIRPQNTWKPSEEQMEALYEETQKSNRIKDDRIVSLYNDLKKLMEE